MLGEIGLSCVENSLDARETELALEMGIESRSEALRIMELRMSQTRGIHARYPLEGISRENSCETIVKIAGF